MSLVRLSCKWLPQTLLDLLTHFFSIHVNIFDVAALLYPSYGLASGLLSISFYSRIQDKGDALSGTYLSVAEGTGVQTPEPNHTI